jgi:hypothetical protein
LAGNITRLVGTRTVPSVLVRKSVGRKALGIALRKGRRVLKFILKN